MMNQSSDTPLPNVKNNMCCKNKIKFTLQIIPLHSNLYVYNIHSIYILEKLMCREPELKVSGLQGLSLYFTRDV